ncbi:MAG: hypothetical protein HY539_00450 [Deltaproteobacteria bacterium]|nr:hypothetical protein [Deltaproteobacteria bacterium]
MKLTRLEFEQRIENGALPLLLIGMSNVGKSFRARQLRDEKGFGMVSIDEEIEKKLGLAGLEALASWMGFPHQGGYAPKEKVYLQTEQAMMQNLELPQGKNFVVDSTGSLIYLGNKILETLKGNYLIVHLEVVESMIPLMTDKFFTRPKPVVWGGMFERRPKEAVEVAYRRCYPEWLQFRLGKYKQLADVSVSGELSIDPKVTIDRFLEEILEKLG